MTRDDVAIQVVMLLTKAERDKLRLVVSEHCDEGTPGEGWKSVVMYALDIKVRAACVVAEEIERAIFSAECDE